LWQEFSSKFSLEVADAREVYIVGDFNDWNTGAHPMKNDGNGTWEKQILLPEGQFEYKFRVDQKGILVISLSYPFP